MPGVHHVGIVRFIAGDTLPLISNWALTPLPPPRLRSTYEYGI